jgi:predicted GNAT family N-acyltransferase
MSWQATARKVFDQFTGRFESGLARTEEEWEGIRRVLREVRGKELNRVVDGDPLQTAAFSGRQVDDTLVWTRDRRTGDIVGCVRVLPARDVAQVESARLEYALDTLPDELLDLSVITTRLAVLPSHRQTIASWVLLAKCPEVAHQVYDAEVGLFTCEPGLYPTYCRLGFRPMGRVHPSPSGGHRIPMITPMDREHLQTLPRPVRRVAKRHPMRHEAAFVAWYRDLEARDGGRVDAGVERVRPSDVAADLPILAELSSSGRAAMLRSAVRFTLTDGEALIREGDGGRNLYLVESGTLEARRGERLLGTIDAGELLGEMAILLDRPRTSDVVARGPARVLMLSRRALSRLGSADDREVVWRSIAELVARRLLRMAGGPDGDGGLAFRRKTK